MTLTDSEYSVRPVRSISSVTRSYKTISCGLIQRAPNGRSTNWARFTSADRVPTKCADSFPPEPWRS